jgi:hypothetical protein
VAPTCVRAGVVLSYNALVLRQRGALVRTGFEEAAAVPGVFCLVTRWCFDSALVLTGGLPGGGVSVAVAMQGGCFVL